MTSNIQLPAWATHLVALVVGTVVFLGSNQEFLALLPATWVTIFHIAGPLFAYLGISQIATPATAPVTPQSGAH